MPHTTSCYKSRSILLPLIPIFLIPVFLLILLTGSLFAQQTELRREVSSGGGEVMESESYRVHGTLSQTAIGRTTGDKPARHNVGFWYWAKSERPALLLGLPELEAESGDTVTVDLSLLESRGLAGVQGSTFITRIRFNGSLLEPIDPGVVCVRENGGCIVEFEGPLPSSNGTIATLRFRAKLGNAPRTPLEIEEFRLTSGSPIDLMRRDGEFRLLDLCRVDGVRLVLDGYATRISGVVPNPVATLSTISFELAENGPAELLLVDGLGRPVALYLRETFDHGAYQLEIDLSAHPVGSYFLVLRTATEQALHPIEVMR